MHRAWVTCSHWVTEVYGHLQSDRLDVTHSLVFSETVEYVKFRNPGRVWVWTSVNMCWHQWSSYSWWKYRWLWKVANFVEKDLSALNMRHGFEAWGFRRSHLPRKTREWTLPTAACFYLPGATKLQKLTAHGCGSPIWWHFFSPEKIFGSPLFNLWKLVIPNPVLCFLCISFSAPKIKPLSWITMT